MEEGKILMMRTYVYISMNYLALIKIIKEMRKWQKRAVSFRNLRVKVVQPKKLNK